MKRHCHNARDNFVGIMKVTLAFYMGKLRVKWGSTSLKNSSLSTDEPGADDVNPSINFYYVVIL